MGFQEFECKRNSIPHKLIRHGIWSTISLIIALNKMMDYILQYYSHFGIEFHRQLFLQSFIFPVIHLLLYLNDYLWKYIYPILDLRFFNQILNGSDHI
jgi:hypothetical protein